MANQPDTRRRQATLLASSVFALLMSLYLMKPAREALLATASVGVSGVELRALASVAQGSFAVLLAALYGRLADRLRRRTLVTTINGVSAAVLVAVALRPGYGHAAHRAWVDVAVYVASGTLGVIVIAQFWAFATDLEGRRAGRMLPLLALAASAGGVIGAYASSWVVSATSDPVSVLCLAAAICLGVGTVLSVVADRTVEWAHGHSVTPQRQAQSAGSFEQLWHHKYLFSAALVTLLAQWVSTNGENLLFGYVQATLSTQPDAQIAGQTMAFYASFSLWSNVAALAVQIVVVYGCAQGRSGRDMLLVLPVLTLASATAMIFVPALGAVKVLKVAENATRYSIHNTASQLLWLPTTTEMKYKAKIVIETVVVRMADILAALTMFIGLRCLGLPLAGLYAFNAVLVAGWVIAAALLVREQRYRLRARVFELPVRTAPQPSMCGLEYELAA